MNGTLSPIRASVKLDKIWWLATVAKEATGPEYYRGLHTPSILYYRKASHLFLCLRLFVTRKCQKKKLISNNFIYREIHNKPPP